MLAEVGTEPPRLFEQRTLEPEAPAARAGREFVRAVCGRWGLGGLADPAALLASELVALAVTHADTALELRVELGDAQLHVAVKDQDPDLARFLAAKEETDRRLSLLIVDRVATAGGSARTRLAARLPGAPWRCPHRTPTWPQRPRPVPSTAQAVALRRR